MGEGSSKVLAQQASHFRDKTGWIARNIGCKTEFALTRISGLVGLKEKDVVSRVKQYFDPDEVTNNL